MSLSEGIPPDFHQKFAAWVRIEPRCRSNNFSEGIAAKIADPLWGLSRQWQVGEFEGEDAGSPVKVEITYETQKIETVGLGSRVVELEGSQPLEMLVEQEPLSLDWHTRVRIGQTFERLLRHRVSQHAEKLIDYYRQRFPVNEPTAEDKSLDRATFRFLKFMKGRVVDGKQLLQVNTLPSPDDISTFREFEEIQNSINSIHVDLQKRYIHYLPQPNSKLSSEAWQPQKLHYQFQLNLTTPESSSPREALPSLLESQPNLVARDYRNGELDWYTFEVQGKIQNLPHSQSICVYPTALRIAGTSPRWWAFEDANTNFGDMDVATPDLAKLILMEFVLIYGDDWFIAPLSVPMGSLVKIKDLKVLNVFDDISGENSLPAIESAQTVVRRAIEARGADPDNPQLRWSMFSLSPASQVTQVESENDGTLTDWVDVLFIPPVAGFRQESPPLEEIRFLRDEGANMVWAVEHTILNGLGHSVDGFEAQLERLARRGEMEQGEPPSVGEGLHYQLASLMPENWIPFIPQAVPDLNYRSIRLLRAEMLRNTLDAEAEAIMPLSRMMELVEEPLLLLEEAIVPRAGLRMQLTYQRVRWVDGKTYIWLGRKVLTGRVQGSSGLQFDITRHLQ